MPTCSHCGTAVTPSFARVFGDNHDEVAGCLQCLSPRELRDRGGAYRE